MARQCRQGLAWLALVVSIIAALAATLGIQDSLRAESPPQPASLIEAGRNIYEQGLLPSGEPLRAIRPGGAQAAGAEAACILCHQKSGMGLVEGAQRVPAIIGPTLFRNEPAFLLGKSPRMAPGMAFHDYHFQSRPPYDDATLARALREGVSSAGQSFSRLMPRYVLADDDMRALTAYLRQLSAAPSPGTHASHVEFATVIAPDTDPEDRDAHLGVLNSCFAQRDPGPDAIAADGHKAWRLNVWTLTGPPETWKSQLDAHYQRTPVFAVVAGLGRDTWAPVEDFCNDERLPCLFPNVDAPGTPAARRYSFYFFKGVFLEAEIAARHLKKRIGEGKISRVVQLNRDGGAGKRAAAALAAALQGSAVTIENRVLTGTGTPALKPLLDDLTETDGLVLWLRERDLAALTQAAPSPNAGIILTSAVMGGKEKVPLAEPWRAATSIIYPYEPPYRWSLRKSINLRPWLTENHQPFADEHLQGNTLAACALLAEGMARLRGRYLREYLVELIENYPLAMGNAPGSQAFPRFSIGPGQRFTSKGAYIARISPGARGRLQQLEGWAIP